MGSVSGSAAGKGRCGLHGQLALGPARPQSGKVTVQPGLGHDQHSHGYELYQGCEGSFPLPGDAGHVGANIFGTIMSTSIIFSITRTIK